MYQAFNVTGYASITASHAYDATILQRQNEEIKQSLKSFREEGIVDGGALSAHWFPTIKADAFISHSHKDETDAVKFAGWLKNTFGLDSFIDSYVWGHAYDLLKIIDNEHSLNPDRKTYDYAKSSRSASHVHMMLAAALSQMLDACECVFFLNSPHSITSQEAVSETKSPWIFYELSTLSTLRRHKPERPERPAPLLESLGLKRAKTAELEVKYPVPLSQLTPLNNVDLIRWSIKYRWGNADSNHALDLLYELNPAITSSLPTPTSPPGG